MLFGYSSTDSGGMEVLWASRFEQSKNFDESLDCAGKMRHENPW
jgi:hypothetical protein